jgi:hypothetical protein
VLGKLNLLGASGVDALKLGELFSRRVAFEDTNDSDLERVSLDPDLKLDLTVGGLGVENGLEDDVLWILDEFDIPINVLETIKGFNEATMATQSVLDDGSTILPSVTFDARTLLLQLTC